MKKLLLFVLLVVLSHFTFAQKQYWTEINYSEMNIQGVQYIFPNHFKSFQLDYQNIKSYLFNAPLDSYSGLVKTSHFEIYIPLPDGSQEVFKIVESPVYEAGLLDNFPGIKTFLAYCPNHPEWYTRLDITPQGFHAIILGTEKGSIYIDPVSHLGLDKESYLVYYKSDFATTKVIECGLEDLAPVEEEIGSSTGQKFGSCQLRTYRLALAATGEYTAFHGGTVAGALAAQVTSMNRINGVYEREMAIHMNLVANNNLIIYTNAGTDPYTNNNGGTMLNENQTNINAVIGSANYDIGHVFSTGGGGIAQLNSPCGTGKARGVTGSGAPVNDPFDIDYVAHEMGHQFGGNHTFNSTSGSCNGNRNLPTAYEPGSGTTIQAYAGICNPHNVQSNSDDYFHGISLQEIGTFITGTGNSCAVVTALANADPTVSYPSSTISIPASTPFSLTAIASDPDNDPLSYCWEQMDNQSSTQPPVATATGGPNFRSLNPNPSPTRYFPNLPAVIAGTSPTWEVLPAVTRTMNFRVVVRDNAPGGGCNDHVDISVNVVGSAGPFVVNNPSNTGITWTGNSTQTVTWSVANTASAPVSCANVNILISYNGGLTFPDTLAQNVANDGSQTVIAPNIATTNALVIVQCANGTFYDVSNNTFTITAITNDYTLNVSNPNQSVCAGDNLSYTVNVGVLGTFTNNVVLSTVGLPAGLVASFSSNNNPPTFSSNLNISNTASLPGGTYNFSVQASSTSGTKTVNLSLVVIPDLSGTLALSTPSNGANGISSPASLTWTNIAGANYSIVLADNPSLSSIVETSAGLTTNSYTTGSLAAHTTYYWSVLAYNTCDTIFSSVFSFTTVNCVLFSNTDTIAISASGTPTITSNLLINGTVGSIADLNVLNLIGDHTYINDLIFTLTSPNGTDVILLDQICGNQNNFNINFDDAAANNNYPCPPTSGGTFIPEEALNAFNGEDANGTWVLTISDEANQDGGELQSWGLEICFNAPTCVPTFDLVNVSACDSITINGNLYTSSSNFTDTLSSSLACDSIVNYNLTIYYADSSFANQFFCAGAPAFYNTIDTNVVLFTNQFSCDSFYIVYTTFLGPDTVLNVYDACAGAPSAYYTTDTIPHAFTNQFACDSFYLDIVTYLPPDSVFVITDSLCSAPGFFGGIQVSSTFQYTNLLGCDSSYTEAIYFLPSEITSDTITTCNASLAGLTTTSFTNIYGCDSTHSSFAILLPSSSSSENMSACDSAFVNGIWYTSSQAISSNFTATNTCDSTHTINLTINQSSSPTLINLTTCNPSAVGSSSTTFTNLSGCDSVVITTTTLLPSASSTQNLSACDSIQVLGNWYFASTSFSDTLAGSAANGCDSVVSYNITINNAVATTENLNACDSAFIAGAWYFASQSIVQNFSSSTSCDSTHTINLSISNSVQTSSALIACDSAFVNGTWYTSSQAISSNFTAANTCDSTHTINLTINQSSSPTLINLTTCNPSAVGTTSTSFTNLSGCDSLVTTTTTLLPSASSTQNLSACDSIQVLGNWYFASTSFTNTLAGSAANGCDSVVTYNITINNAVATTENLNACDSAFVAGAWYFASQSIVQNFSSSTSCDSTHTINLSISNSVQTSSTLIACDSAFVNGTWYTSSQAISSNFTAANTCDSTHTINLTINQSSSPTLINLTTCNPSAVGTTSTSFTNLSGCDSLVIINTTLLASASSTLNLSACDSIQVLGNWYFSSASFSDTLAGSAANGCDSIVTYNISINNAISVTVNTSSCSLADTGVFVSSFTSVNGCDSILTNIVSFAGLDTTFITSPTCNIMEIGATLLTVYSFPNNCDSAVVQTYYFEAYEIEILSSDSFNFINQEIELSASTFADTYTWSASNIVESNDSSFAFTSSYVGAYQIVLEASYDGCEANDTLSISFISDQLRLEVPTGFSPNGDGVNDYFHVLNAQQFSSIEIKVLNSRNQVMFFEEGSDPKWDGGFKSKQAPIAVYIYSIRGISATTGEVVDLLGNISLIR